MRALRRIWKNFSRGEQIIWQSSSNLDVLGARKVTGSKFRVEGTQKLGTNVLNLVATVTWCQGFVHPIQLLFVTGHLMPNITEVTSRNRKYFDILEIQLCYSWFQTFAVFWMLYSFFWVIPRRLNFIFRRFGTHFHLHRRCKLEE